MEGMPGLDHRGLTFTNVDDASEVSLKEVDTMRGVRRHSMLRLTAVAALVIAALATVSANDNWPKFRGPNAGVGSDDPQLPNTWSSSQNVIWKFDVPVQGRCVSWQ